MGALEWDVYKASMLTSSASLDEITEAFRDAAGAFAEILDRPEVQRAWAEPSALEGYSVGGIVAHVNGAIGWTERLLDLPVPLDGRAAPRDDFLRFWHSLKIDPDGADRLALHDVLRDQFEQAATRGWESTRDRFLTLAKQLGARLDGEAYERALDLRPTAPLIVCIGDLMPSRVVELVVHGDDLAASVGVDAPRLSKAAASVSIDLLMAVARRAHGDVAVVRALARRERASSAVFPVV